NEPSIMSQIVASFNPNAPRYYSWFNNHVTKVARTCLIIDFSLLFLLFLVDLRTIVLFPFISFGIYGVLKESRIPLLIYFFLTMVNPKSKLYNAAQNAEIAVVVIILFVFMTRTAFEIAKLKVLWKMCLFLKDREVAERIPVVYQMRADPLPSSIPSAYEKNTQIFQHIPFNFTFIISSHLCQYFADSFIDHRQLKNR
ncbi:hypothetical protein PFISCL1PPCAC_5425, partial [Pristionchus fissidentatus]